ncbi:MAG: hypothetical protein JWM95_3278 [Gemmatimonadetes bacterium]|nr:hypothetical protein [Gemmatimonadota bacterium]
MSIARFASPLALGAMLAVAAPARAPLARGFTYDLVQRTQSTNPMNGGAQDVVAMRAHVQVDAAGHTRVDFADAARNPLWSTGDYAIISGSSIQIISPQKKEVLDLGPDMGMGSMQEFMKAMGADMKITDGAIAFDSLPGSDVVNGHPTKHFHITREATTSMTTPMGAMDIPVKSEIDYYVTRDRAPQNSAFIAPGLSSGMGAMISAPALERMRTLVGGMKGFVMKMVTHSTSTMMGMSTDITATVEVQDLLEADVASIPIAPPAGYAKANLADRMRAMSPRPPGS